MRCRGQEAVTKGELAIIQVAEVVTDRERALFKGEKERLNYGPFEMVLYWEPHYDGEFGSLEPATSFTVDCEGRLGTPQWFAGKRYRFRTLAEADAKVEELKELLLVEIGKIAFRIN
jgi:hypothetical protein